MNLNKVLLIGRLVADPETRTTPGGQTVCSFRMATNRIWNDPDTREKQEKTDYHSIVAWRKLGEICSQYLIKGKLIFIEGRLETRSWQDQEGNKRYRTEVIAENMQMGPKSAGATGPRAETSPEENEEEPSTAGEPTEEEIEVKDIPF